MKYILLCGNFGSIQVIESLNVREVDGYEPLWLPLFTDDPSRSSPEILVDRALTYIAPPTNPRFLGFASHQQIAKHISNSGGLSGPNLEYIINLNDALLRMGYPDRHLSSIVEIACTE